MHPQKGSGVAESFSREELKASKRIPVDRTKTDHMDYNKPVIRSLPFETDMLTVEIG